VLTDVVRDHAFTIAWFGLMTMVWFGWGQEDPPESWRWRLGVGSVAGIALAGVFGYAVAIRWDEGSALEGRYEWFGVIVAIEVVAAGLGCLYLWRSGRERWMAWWVAVVVALHFVPLAFFLEDGSLAVLAVVQLVALAVLVPRLRIVSHPTSRHVGPVMGATLLAFAVTSAVVFLVDRGSPW